MGTIPVTKQAKTTGVVHGTSFEKFSIFFYVQHLPYIVL